MEIFNLPTEFIIVIVFILVLVAILPGFMNRDTRIIKQGKGVEKIQRISFIIAAIGGVNGILVCWLAGNDDFRRFFHSPSYEELALTMFYGFFILQSLSLVSLAVYSYPWRPILLVITASVGFSFNITQWILPAPFLLIAAILDWFIYEQHSKERHEKIIRHLVIGGSLSGVFLYFSTDFEHIISYTDLDNRGWFDDYIPLVYFALAFITIWIRNHIRTAILGLAVVPFLFIVWKYVILSDYQYFDEVASWYPWMVPGLMFSVAGWLSFSQLPQRKKCGS
jgi:hypothetical protein